MTDLSRFSRSQLERFQRHFSLTGFGPEAQLKLLDARVLVIGAGALGSSVLPYLAAAGVGTIDVVDDDVVDRSNLHRQVIHSEQTIGELKTVSAAERMRGLHPEIQVNEIRELITPANALSMVEPVDIVVDGCDNFATRYVVSDACEIAGKPLVSGSILRFNGQISLFWSTPTEDLWPEGGRGPTYRDLYPQAPDPGEVPTCAEAGVLGVLPGVIGSVMATETIKFLTGIGEPLLGRVLNYDALSAGFREIRLLPDPDREPVTTIGADVAGLGGFDPRVADDVEDAAGGDGAQASAEEDPGTEAQQDGTEAQQEPAEAAQAQEPTSSSAAPEVEVNPYTGRAKQDDELSPAQLRSALDDGRISGLIDVREPWEHQLDTISEAVNIPLMQLAELQDPPPGLDEATESRPMVLYCAHGIRSRQALQLLQQNHPEAALRNLMGGFELYRSS